MTKHSEDEIFRALLHWKPRSASGYMMELIKDYVSERPVKSWKKVLSRAIRNECWGSPHWQ